MLDTLDRTAVHCARIQLRGVRRVFPGGVEAISSLDLDIAGGEFVSILGPSGCGKSTLLRIIAGLDHADSGTVSVTRTTNDRPNDEDAITASEGIAPSAAPRPRVAFVFQDAHLLPWRTVLRNVALPLELARHPPVPRRQRLDQARHAIEKVGLTDAIQRYPAQLSGGMRMRVSLARALVTDPELLLLDEPFAALDEITRHQLDEQLRSLWDQRRMTVLFVTHSINEAAILADRAIVLTRRPARIVIDHALDLPPDRPAELRADPRFARECGVLLDALKRGGAIL
jgi:NitT/TauT family transport system ATP-binding protein